MNCLTCKINAYEKPDHEKGLIILEIKLLEIDEKIEFPSGWELEDVIGNEDYDNNTLTKRPV